MGNLVGRFVKVSDRGLYDEVARTEGAVQREDAKTRLDVLEALRQERQTGQFPAWANDEMRQNPYFAGYLARKRAALELQRQLTPFERGVVQPKSARTKMELLSEPAK
jgi:hypothetical protein